jgi:hypothetical protein
MQLGQQSQTKWTGWLFGLVAVVWLGFITVMGGTPPPEMMTVFVIGVLVTIGGTAVIGAIGWHLLVRPLPTGQKVVYKQLLTGQRRHIVGLLMVIGLVNVAIGSTWDEIWHSNYGIPFGEDFFWRPHQMLYFGFIVTIGVAAWGLYNVLMKGEGTLQQRFRSDPVVGLAIISGAYLAFALPADPIWHSIYGVDLTAWSLPHVVLLVMVLLMGISAAAMQLSSEPARQWAAIWQGGTWRDGLMVIIFTSVMMVYLLVFIIEWYFFPTRPGLFTLEIDFLSKRPDWLLSALLLLISVFIGGIALFTTRRIGVVTLMALIGLGTRFIVEAVLQSPYTGMTPYVVIVPAMLALDVASYVLLVQRQQFNRLILALAVTLTFAVIGLPAMSMLFAYPQVTLTNAPIVIIVAFIVTYISLWMAEVVGDFLRGLEVADATAAVAAPVTRRIWIDGVVYAGFSLFALFLMLTAVPPA